MSKTPEFNAMPHPQAAMYYASIGWSVFPLVASGKIPYKGSRGYIDATTDLERIQTWWTTHPLANIGVATGERSGVIVLDIDPPEGHFSLKELQAKHAPLPDTRRSRTGNKGLHFFFQYPNDGNTYKNAVGLQGKIGVDVRATGGYVVLPPSKLHGRLKYIWGNPETPIAPLPNWLAHLLLTEQRQREEYPQGLRFARNPADIWLQRAVSKAHVGNRNAVGFWLACQLRDDHISEAEARSIILTYANQVQEGNEPYTSKEAIASVRSAYKRPSREQAKRLTP